MGLEIRDDCRYLETHEWARLDDGTATIGISDFAQDELGDIVFVELPSAGEQIEANTEFGVIESIKAVSDLYAPVSGEVLEVNDRLETEPELVNEDPFGEGWMLQVGPVADDEYQALLSPSEYEDKTA